MGDSPTDNASDGSEPDVINSAFSAAAVTFVWRAAGDEGLAEMLGRLGQPDLTPILDPEQWVPYSYFRRLADAAATVCADPDFGNTIGEEVVRLMVERDLVGELVEDDVGRTLEMVVAGMDASSAVRDVAVVARAERQMVVEGTALIHADDRLICRVFVGLLSAFPAAIGVSATAVERECVAAGADRCRFDVRWTSDQVSAPDADPTGPLARTLAWASTLADADGVEDALTRACESVLAGVAGVRVDISLPDGRRWEYSSALDPGFGDSKETTSASAPVVVGGRESGRLQLHDLGESGPAEFQRAERLAQELGSAFTTAVVFADLRERAQRDPLTGAANRRALEQRASSVLAGAESAALVFVDLDDFKEVNDRFGHAAGDVALRGVARRLTDHVRAGDLVARVGGDEFIVLLADTPTDESVDGARVKLAAVFTEPFAVDGRSLSLRASFGLARYPEDGADLADLVGVADQRMYEVKRRR